MSRGKTEKLFQGGKRAGPEVEPAGWRERRGSQIEVVVPDGAYIGALRFRPGDHAGDVEIQAFLGFPAPSRAELGGDDTVLIGGE